ncbi:MAG: hypothetical protein ACPGNT_08080, partial [Rhodospirillales bacterium]
MEQIASLDCDTLADDGVSFLVSLRVRYEDGDLCRANLSALIVAMADAPGCENVDVIRRHGGLGIDFYLLARFSSHADLERWEASPERHRHLDGIEALAIADVSHQRAAGANIWFEPVSVLPSTPKPPLLWKRWVLSLLAVYPALMVLFYVFRPVTRQLPDALGLLLLATILTGLTSAFIVPWLS